MYKWHLLLLLFKFLQQWQNTFSSYVFHLHNALSHNQYFFFLAWIISIYVARLLQRRPFSTGSSTVFSCARVEGRFLTEFLEPNILGIPPTIPIICPAPFPYGFSEVGLCFVWLSCVRPLHLGNNFLPPLHRFLSLKTFFLPLHVGLLFSKISIIEAKYIW